ncbi:hypothetical protein BH11MYX4_BH11MYX4_59940 [soil metagenome]
MELRLLAVTMLGLLAVSGCSSVDSGYKAGELGNGGFYFACSDAVSCARYSDDAAKFPKAVSIGSSFQVRFVSKTSANDTHITFNEQAADRGITISPVGEFISRGPNGLVALKTGWATITSRDAAGQLVDFVNIHVAKPDALVVYDADRVHSGDTPDRVDALTLTLSASEPRYLRAFAQEKNSVLAGTLAVEWSRNPEAVVYLQDNDGKVTVRARKPGTTTLTATGGTFTQQITIEVKP